MSAYATVLSGYVTLSFFSAELKNYFLRVNEESQKLKKNLEDERRKLKEDVENQKKETENLKAGKLISFSRFIA